jgi:hypothetical protein
VSDAKEHKMKSIVKPSIVVFTFILTTLPAPDCSLQISSTKTTAAPME